MERRDQCDDHHKSCLSHEPRSFGGTTNILGSIGCAETEIATQSMAHIIAVDHHSVTAALSERPVYSVGDRQFAGAGKSGEPRNCRSLAQRAPALLMRLKRLPGEVLDVRVHG